MMGFGKLAVLGAALAVLSACEVADNAVKPSLTGNPATGTAAAAKSSPAPAAPVGVVRNADGSVTVPRSTIRSRISLPAPPSARR